MIQQSVYMSPHWYNQSITYLLRTGFRRTRLMSFLFSPNNNKPSTNVGLAKSSIQVLWVPKLSSSKSSLQLFYHWNMSEKGNAQRIKKTTSSHWRRLFCAKSWKPSIPTKINVSSVFLNWTILILVRIYFLVCKVILDTNRRNQPDTTNYHLS